MARPDILVVDDDASAIQLVAAMLAELGEVRFATNGADALRLARERVPDLVLLDAEMPSMSGFEVCATLKGDPRLRDVAVVFVTSHHEPEFEVSGFEAGAADFIAKPINPPLLLARVKTHLRAKQLADEMRRIATVDALTGVWNRRRFDEALEWEWLRARRAGEPLTLLLLDVDHFKLFNDRYGHPAGDACLRAVALALDAACRRPADLVARYGGEEFAVLLPGTPRGGAEHVVRAVLAAIDALEIPHDASPVTSHLTLSIGMACYDDASQCWLAPLAVARTGDELQTRCSAADLVEAADKALYSAKTSGRARARMLDIADVDIPWLVQHIAAAPGQALDSVQA
jgi:diguanylate cyclase (GGDEF)-like protein